MSNLTVLIILIALAQTFEALIVWFVLKQYEMTDHLRRESIKRMQKRIEELERKQKSSWKFKKTWLPAHDRNMN